MAINGLNAINMNFHTLLQDQINNHLTPQAIENQSVKAFIQSVNESYLSFESNLESKNAIFIDYKNENNEIKDQLNKEIEIKKLATSTLYKTIKIEDLDKDNLPKDDLLFVSNYLEKQISQRDKAEVALLENMKKLQNYEKHNSLILSASLNSIITVDQSKNVTYWNPKAESVFGWTKEEVLGKNMIDLLIPTRYRILWSNLIDLYNKNKKKENSFLNKKQEITLINKAGIEFFVEIAIIPIHQEDAIYFCIFIQDITQRTQNLELLKQSEEHNRLILNTSLNSIVTVDTSKNITFWNLQAETIFGWKQEEALGKNMVDLIIPKRYSALWNNLMDLYQKNKEDENEFLCKNLELILINKEGKEFYGETTIIPIHQEDAIYFCGFIQDITKRKEAEKQLKNNVSFLNSLLANLNSGVLVFDNNDKIVFLNQQYCDLRNIQGASSEFIGKDVFEFASNFMLNADETEKSLDRMRELTKSNQIIKGELVNCPEGKTLERDYIPITMGNEKTLHLIKINDVTERVQNQKRIKQSEVRSNLIMNASLNAIITIDSTEKVTFWNHQAATIFGKTRKEMVGQGLSAIFEPQQYLDPSSKELKEFTKISALAKLKKRIELKGKTSKGSEITIEISVIPIKVNEENFYCASIQDITERKEAEIIRKIQEEKYKNIITNMNLGFIEIGTKQEIKFVNSSFTKMSGYDLNEIKGKKLTDFLGASQSVSIINSKHELRRQGKSDLYQVGFKNKKGEQRWWAVSGAPSYDANNNFIGTIGIHLDITEQKQLEIALEIEKTKAVEASKAKEVFLANMSHEIRTPLNAIIGFLRELNKQELTQFQSEFVNNSKIASKHLLAIINNILDISKIEAGEMELENVDFIFEKVISNVSLVLQPMFKQKELQFNSTISNSVAKVLKGDSLRLQQILFNLVGNAVKFTNKGSVTINCEVINDDTFSQELKISVIDTGIGMESSYVETIFNKFSQEDKAITRKYGGTGLGLSITNELVKLFNGRIEIESKKNTGTSIQIFIEFKKGNIQNIKEINIDNPVARIDNISILLVEDNYMNRMVAQNSLGYYDCKVTEAKNGLEAIAILKKEKFDVILMDVQMPEMGGIEATEIIRKELQLSTPIIALTANAFKTEIDKCKKAGMDDYITKPFEEEDLIEKIAKYTIKNQPFYTTPITKKVVVNDKLYNLESLDKLSRGNKEFVLKMMRIFIEQTTETFEKVTTAINTNNFIEVSRLIHKIKPSVESLGIVSVKKEIDQLEKLASVSNDKELISSLFYTIRTVLEQVIIQFNENELNQ